MSGPEKTDEILHAVGSRDVASRQFAENSFAVGGPTVQQRLFPVAYIPCNLAHCAIAPEGERHRAFFGLAIEMLGDLPEMRFARRFDSTNFAGHCEVDRVEERGLAKAIRTI